MGRPTKENTLTRKDVIEAAIACLDREGESALGVNRVARELGIKPPAIYKHLDGNAGLRKAVVIAIWQKFFAYYKQQTAGVSEPRALLIAGGHATRDFARSHPALYRTMMQVQLQPDDPEAAPIIQEALGFFRIGLESYGFSENQLIDVMRMVNAAVSGFIAVEQAGLLTLNRSTDASFAVMLDALFVAIEYIRAS
ncbi:TetR family transcriptional regulator [Fischerella major NIES-592]|uniref:TetR family transcriptional regulator n=2 Tax=Fischerella TaxID=1190 RepID=A0A1U7GYS3_9CYAN|nr:MULTISPECIES: TetR/AcrR family transcriptional regulator [Fischerella]OKH13577.1 TetR family transcriptional regulator [Fischerella major NIES-592]PMB38507.1 TetR/AcrR family transcriptional regulator [Fischerella thermalis CCMEE 5330]BAU06811.1 transcriptional regulator [Fischerella sp. NIES-3754]